ncbi:MAG: chemotaxis-specific protein-glutamate methyltransferase CheB [Magnetospirillum sp.]|nr:chemotaxis-specific protein-glutamate methyltransferase CheB [Magnetospirillum sp.]
MTSPPAIRVLLVDDSSLARGLLRSFLEDDGGFAVVGEARNGREAVEMTRALRPDLVTMDLEMPVMGGLDAIEEIMCTKAVPILVVSSVADAQNAYAAVAKGAVDVVSKPSLDPAEHAEFVAKAKLVAKIPVITHVRALRVPPLAPCPVPSPPVTSPSGREGRVFAIASSTGGPQALAKLLAALPGDFPCPILVAQHIADGFAAGMADWLTTLSPLPVRLATDGMLVESGAVILAPSERHLVVTSSRRLNLLERGERDVYRPSCDALLTSVANVWGKRAVGIILTGMGSDGAKGMAAIKAAGGATIAQDEASSVIYGMNRVAVEKGAAARVLGLDGIAPAMRDLARGLA